MANIMLTDSCNLNCPYCFANEFVNKKANEITEEAFDKAADFILGDGTHASVGLIGGEPTIHPKFDLFLRKLIRNPRVKDIIVYTNGICLDRYWDIITHKKVHLLINCNSPAYIGEEKYKKLVDNIDILIRQKEAKDSTALGINMFCADFEYQYLLDLLIKYEFRHLRVSVTVPNLEENRNIDAHEYFRAIKPRMLEFFQLLLENNVVPHFDCNKIPSCLFTEDEYAPFRKYLEKPEIKEDIGQSNIVNDMVECSPVIDIRQDLTAVRCFGLSESTKQDIRKYKGIKDLENYYVRTIDAYAYNTVYSEKCADCYRRSTLKCSGGCYAFKINEILAMGKFAEERLKSRENRDV